MATPNTPCNGGSAIQKKVKMHLKQLRTEISPVKSEKHCLLLNRFDPEGSLHDMMREVSLMDAREQRDFIRENLDRAFAQEGQRHSPTTQLRQLHLEIILSCCLCPSLQNISWELCMLEFDRASRSMGDPRCQANLLVLARFVAELVARGMLAPASVAPMTSALLAEPTHGLVALHILLKEVAPVVFGRKEEQLKKEGWQLVLETPQEVREAVIMLDVVTQGLKQLTEDNWPEQTRRRIADMLSLCRAAA